MLIKATLKDVAGVGEVSVTWADGLVVVNKAAGSAPLDPIAVSDAINGVGKPAEVVGVIGGEDGAYERAAGGGSALDARERRELEYLRRRVGELEAALRAVGSIAVAVGGDVMPAGASHASTPSKGTPKALAGTPSKAHELAG